MIDAIVALGDTLPGLSAARLAVLWYLVPASGAVLWIAVGFDAGRRTSAAVAALVTMLVVVGFARLAGVGDLGAGAWLATGGAIVAGVAAGWRRPSGAAGGDTHAPA